MSLNYPSTNTIEQLDNYHGVEVPDPYRWLEDLESAETKAWVEAQNQVTFGYLEQISARDRIKARLTQLWDYEKYSIPFKEGDRYFYFKNGCKTKVCCTCYPHSMANRAFYSIPTSFPTMEPLPYLGYRLAKMATTSPMVYPVPVPIGKNGRCAILPPAKIYPIA
jgi:hypothetical protein